MAVRCLPWLLGLVVALVGGSLAAGEEPAKPPVFSVQTSRGAIVRGALRQLKADWSLRLGDGDGALVAGPGVVAVRRRGVALPPLPGEDFLLLANGDRLPFQAVRLASEKLNIRHADLAGGEETALPLAAVSLLWRIAPDKTFDAEKLRRRLAVQARTRDTVCLRNGDVVSGVLTALDERQVEVEVEKKQVTVKTPQVAYIALNTELAETMRPKGMYARLVLTDTERGRGGRLSLTSAACADGATLTGTTTFGARLRVPLRRVAALDVFQGAAVHLSDLKPSKYEFLPYLDETWPFAADANVLEHDLLLGGSTYDKGIGMHSHSRLTYRLAGNYRRFEALVGLDDKDGRDGDVRIHVLADGKELDLKAGRERTFRSGPLPIAVKVEGVRELTLEVDFGRNGSVHGVVNWVDARLIK